MDVLRVLVLSQNYPREGDPGSGIFIHQQLRHLKQKNCESVVVSPLPYLPWLLTHHPRWKKYRQGARTVMMDHIPVHYPRFLCLPGTDFHPLVAYSLYLGVGRLVSALVATIKPHLLHAHMATPDGYFGLLLSRRLDVPLIVSLLGSDINVYPGWSARSMRMTRRVLNEAGAVTAVSDSLKEAAASLAPQAQDIDVVSMGCDVDGFTFDPVARAQVRARLGIDEKDSALVFVGRLVAAKGIWELVESFRILHHEHKHLHLIFVGDGDVRVMLEKMVQTFGLQARVHLAGVQPHDQIPTWLSAGDLFVLPSHNEGLPNVVVEAMACSRPVVATDVGGIPEIVEDGKSGILVHKHDVGALTDAIAGLLATPDRRRSMGERGREIVKRSFSWENSAREMKRIYLKVISPRSLGKARG